MFHHVKELQFNARVSKPDPRFAALLLEQFGGGNGELKAAMQYFVQSFAARKPHPELYDLLMDIATEEFSHLEIVGATITMLTDGIKGELKNAVDVNPVAQMAQMSGGAKEDMIHAALQNPQFLVQTGGGPAVTNASGVPWMGTYVNANGDPTVDLRSNIAAESRAKIVYEYLLKFTDDTMVQESLRFLMTREIAHFQQFTAALNSIEANFPPGQLQGDVRYTHAAFNMSDGEDMRGPWNQGQGPWNQGEEWNYIADPIKQVRETNGLVNLKPQGTKHSPEEMKKLEKKLSEERSKMVKNSAPEGEQQWSRYGK
ncbi:MAG: manganese catalase family protein [Ignavibacteria bacterium]|jgi:Mn-containing catalase|nr:manganese catalase family protein [Ignavibacteria bacterium]MCU7502257.1 manganese catalase family protein [Ignavibacteria bacterium]MCU7516699.1 manganese catalase family protein [Ignavibacteria bacterium]